MTTFKAFLKVLNKCKAPVIMYTVFLIIFAGINLQTKNENTDFVSTKPDIVIVNEDEEVGITKSLVTYLKDNCNIPNIKEDKKSRDDALFYRDISLIIYIPKNFHEDFLVGKNPEIKIESNGDYKSSLASMILTRFPFSKWKISNKSISSVSSSNTSICRLLSFMFPIVPFL